LSTLIPFVALIVAIFFWKRTSRQTRKRKMLLWATKKGNHYQSNYDAKSREGYLPPS